MIPFTETVKHPLKWITHYTLVERLNYRAATFISTLSAALLTDEVHANPVPSVHFLLDVPVDHQVLWVPYGVVGTADHECGAAVRGDQVGVAGGAGDGHGTVGASPDGYTVVLAWVVAVAERLLAPASILGVSRWRCHGGQA